MGFRHLDAAERYRNEAEVGAALKELFADGTVRREDLFVTTKLWNNNHRPERVKPALQASLNRLGLDAVDLYLVHTPFAFQPGDDQDPRDTHGSGHLRRRRHAGGDMGGHGSPRREGLSRAIGLSESTPKHPRSSIPPASSQRSWKSSRIHITRSGSSMNCARLTGSSCWRSPRWGMRWNRDCSTIPSSSRSLGGLEKTPAQVLLAWGIQRGTAVLTGSVTPSRIRENFDVTALPESAIEEINERLETRLRFNPLLRAESRALLKSPRQSTASGCFAARKRLSDEG